MATGVGYSNKSCSGRDLVDLWLGTGAFVASSFFTWRIIRRKQRADRLRQGTRIQGGGFVSRRGERILAPTISYVGKFLACLQVCRDTTFALCASIVDSQGLLFHNSHKLSLFLFRCLFHQDPCDPVNRPEGYIPLCVAENKLNLEMVADRFMKASSSAFSDLEVYCYNTFTGFPLARQAVAYFLARKFLYPEIPNLSADVALSNIRIDHIGLSSGAAAILNHLFTILGDTGDGCLIPAPYYAAFDTDININAGIVPIAVEQSNPVQGASVAELNEAYQNACSVRIASSLAAEQLLESFSLVLDTSMDNRKGTNPGSYS